jgi:PadR family transcriptional regulator, regulatory protein PadR
MPNEKAGLLQGTLDLMILQTLSSLGAQHGYAIAERIELVSNGSVRLNMGTLYPGLVRLEARGWISAEWRTTETNRRARYYQLTKAGTKRLAQEREQWRQTAGLMERILEAES